MVSQYEKKAPIRLRHEAMMVNVGRCEFSTLVPARMNSFRIPRNHRWKHGRGVCSDRVDGESISNEKTANTFFFLTRKSDERARGVCAVCKELIFLLFGNAFVELPRLFCIVPAGHVVLSEDLRC